MKQKIDAQHPKTFECEHKVLPVFQYTKQIVCIQIQIREPEMLRDAQKCVDRQLDGDEYSHCACSLLP